MGSLVGHVAPGFGFLIIGLWHLYHHIKLHTTSPKHYKSQPWFPSQTFRYAELALIIIGSLLSITMELFISPAKHQPLDTDWTIPSYHLHNFEHSSISLTFLLYATFAIILDRSPIKNPVLKHGLTQIIAAVAFAQQLLMFRLHSTDHVGVEGQYHWLLQLVIAVSLATTILGVWKERSFMVSFVRSVSVVFQGVWFIVMGYALWSPSLIPKGCFMNMEEGHYVVRCKDDESLHRAKSLVNIEFSWVLVGVVAFSMCFYLFFVKRFGDEGKYFALDEEGTNADLESQKMTLDEYM